MKIETYDNWKIITERNSLTYLSYDEKLNDIVKIDLDKENTYYCRIEKDINANKYIIKGCIFGFDFEQFLKTQINDDNYHTLINEANDIIRGWLTVLHEDILSMINILPEI